MATFPTAPRSALVEWCQAHEAVFQTHATEIGLTEPQVAAFKAARRPRPRRCCRRSGRRPEKTGRARRTYLPMQKRPKISPSRSSAVNSPVIAPSAFCAARNSSA